MKDYDVSFENVYPNNNSLARAIVTFENGYGASIITGEYAKGDAEHPYEVGVLKLVIDEESNESWLLCYDSGITDDIIPYLNKKGVYALLERIEALYDER